MQKHILIVIFCSTLFGCSNTETKDIMLLNGYWEIVKVKKNNTILKAYNVNTSVDYFEIQKDSSGFRKKVAPTLKGTYIISQHASPINLQTKQDKLHISYKMNDTIVVETITKLSKEELIIANNEGFIYIYKPFQALNLEL